MIKKLFKKSGFVILVGILLSVILQSVFLFIIKDDPRVYFNGNFVPLWTHDAGLYGFYAKKLLGGANFPFASEYIAGWLLYAVVKFTPFSIEQCIFYLPVILSSLVIIPIFYISKLFKLQRVGFVAGIFCILSYGYYYRSFFGYYDTDILNLFFPLVAIWGLIGLSKTQNAFYSLLATLGIFGFGLWYHSYLSIAVLIVGIWAIYTLVFQRENLENYLVIFMMGICFLNLDLWIKLALILLIFILNFQRYKTHSWLFGAVFIILSVGATFLVDTHKFYSRALSYIDKGLYTKFANLNFINALDTIGEADAISLQKWAQLSSANASLAFLGFFGFVMLCIKYRPFLAFLPLVLVGFLSLIAGERFAMYGVGAFSFGLAYFIFILSQMLPKYKNISFFILSCAISIVYINTIIHFAKIEKPVFYKEDLEVISKIPKHKNNFILTWWDFGWPLWYETGAKTLIDNGKHFEDSYIISELLFESNQTKVANSSKQVVKLYKEAKSKGYYKLIPYLFKKNKPHIAIENLSKPSKLVDPIFWYLHVDLLKVGTSIKLFSDTDLKTGKQKVSSFIVYARKASNISFDKDKGILTLNGQSFKIKYYTNLKTKEYKHYKMASLYAIETPKYYFISTKNVYDSFLVQALIFNNINEKQFKIISKNDTSIILKIK